MRSILGCGIRLLLAAIVQLQPHAPARLVDATASAHRALYAGLSDGEVFTSIDGGLRWMPIGKIGLAIGDSLTGLAVDALGSILYAGTSAGLYRSTDAGNTWRLSLPDAVFPVTAPQTPGMAYALDEPLASRPTLLTTRDGGLHWARQALPQTIARPESLTLDPGDADTLSVDDTAGTYLSDDGGRTWRLFAGLHGVVWDGGDPGIAYAEQDGAPKLYRTTDRGANWHPSQISADIGTPLAVLDGHPAHVLGTTFALAADAPGAAQQAQGIGSSLTWLPDTQSNFTTLGATGPLFLAFAGDFYTSRTGVRWVAIPTPFTSAKDGDTAITALVVGPRPARPTDPLPPPASVPPPPPPVSVHGVLYSGGNQDGAPYVAGVANDATAIDCGSPPPADGIEALLVDPRTPTTLYAGTQHGLLISHDGCLTWSTPSAPISGSVSALAADTGTDTIYAAELPDSMWVSSDGGAQWQHQQLPQATPITALAVVPGSPALLLVGSQAGIFLSRDGGATWLPRAPLLGAARGINALAVDPSAPGEVWAVGTAGVYRTQDGGTAWQALQLPPDNNGYGVQSFSVDSHPLVGYTAVAVGLSGVVLVGDAGAALYQSLDHGSTWRITFSSFSDCKDGCSGISALGFDPSVPSEALMYGIAGYGSISLDSGTTWPADLLEWTSIAGPTVVAVATTRQPLPSDPVPPPAHLLAGSRYVAKTQHLIGATFRSFYDQHDGPRAFGLPLTEVFDEGGQTVQVFERARLVAGPGGVTISPLGYWLTASRAFPTTQAASANDSARYFPQTGQMLGGSFLSYWQAHEGPLLLGAPISGELQEQNGDGSGRSYLLQWFANGRLEYHPDLRGTSYVVSSGLVGREWLQLRNWL